MNNPPKVNERYLNCYERMLGLFWGFLIPSACVMILMVVTAVQSQRPLIIPIDIPRPLDDDPPIQEKPEDPPPEPPVDIQIDTPATTFNETQFVNPEPVMTAEPVTTKPAAVDSWEGQPISNTALALLCYLAHGETPRSEEFGATVESALEYLIGDDYRAGREDRRSGRKGIRHRLLEEHRRSRRGRYDVHLPLRSSADGLLPLSADDQGLVRNLNAAVHSSSRLRGEPDSSPEPHITRDPRHDFDARAFTRAHYPVGRNHIVPVNVLSCDCRLSLAQRGFALVEGLMFYCAARLESAPYHDTQ